MDGVGSGTSGTHRTPFRSSDQTQSDEASEGRGESTAGRRGDRRSPWALEREELRGRERDRGSTRVRPVPPRAPVPLALGRGNHPR